MRWDDLTLDDAAVDPARALWSRRAVTRTFDTPEFRGITFHEVTARSALNKVPEASRMPFRWTVNPYRGCSHACVYCFARKTHEYLELDAGHDFDSQIVVKTNVGEVLARELARPSWSGEHVAMGTNVDCYQRAEGRYHLMPGIIRALTEAGNPFSILTKGTLILRDLDLLMAAAERTDVSAAVSVGLVDPSIWRSVEPGTPSPMRRLDAVRRLNDAGIPCGVLMAPILPFLTDSENQLAATVSAVAAAGATHVSPIVLHLRPGAREWWQAWLARERPDLLPRFAELYGDRSYAPASYRGRITSTVRALAHDHGVGRAIRRPGLTGHERARSTSPRPAPGDSPYAAGSPVTGGPQFFPTPADLAAWFAAHAGTETELHLGYWKKGSGRPSVTWPESVDEALCVGWIDGVRRRIDDQSYVIRFTPRKLISTWSDTNVRRVTELTKQGRMSPPGLAAFEARRADRSGIYSFEQKEEPRLDDRAEATFRADVAAWEFFTAQAPSYRRAAVWWVVSAKQQATRDRRLTRLVEDSRARRRLEHLSRP